MASGSHIFKKSPVAFCIAGALSLASLPAQSVSWDVGDWSINFDSTFSFGTSVRVEDRNIDYIGKSNLGFFDYTDYNAATNPIYASADVWSISQGVGSYSTNGDLGNQNFDSGEAFSTQFKGLHELNISNGDMGFFLRGMYFYDFELKEGDRAYVNPLSGVRHEPCSTDAASEELCADIRLLDAFFYSDFYMGDVPVSLRIGEQVISWGESTFIQHGINTINPVDVSRARAPGAELKEVFIPVGTVFVNASLTDNFGISAYYQYEWEPSRLPQAGSYFASNDFAGEGGQGRNIQLGFAGNPDMDLDFLLNNLNGLGAAVDAGALDAATAASAYLAYPTKVAIRGFSDSARIDADDGGQYGIKFTYFAEELNETELSLYLINYHSKRPLLSGIASDFSSAALVQDVGVLAATGVTKDTITDLRAFGKVRMDYPEDLKLYGFSFNTNIGETAFAGEFSYRVDEPLQIDDVELLYMASPQQLFNEGLRPDLGGLSQLTNIGRPIAQGGDYIQGYITSDTFQMQFTASHIFGPTMGTDNLVFLAEAGYVNVMDFPDPSVLRLNSPGTARTLTIEPTADGNTREGLHQALSDGPETNPFATETAWGYRLLANASFNNVMAGINLNVRATFAHDVDGTTPDPMFLFLEERKSGSIAFNFDYLNKWTASFSYNSFWDGVGTTNSLSDRDFVSFNIKYSI